MKKTHFRPSRLPKTLGTKINIVTYHSFQAEAKKRGISESQLLRIIISEVIALHRRGLLIVPDSDIYTLTELSCTLGTKVPLETYQTFCGIARAIKISQSDLLRYGIGAYFQTKISTENCSIKPFIASISAEKNQKLKQGFKYPQIPVINIALGTNQKVSGRNWIEQMQIKAAKNLLLSHQISQLAGAMVLLLSRRLVRIS